MKMKESIFDLEKKIQVLVHEIMLLKEQVRKLTIEKESFD